MKYTIALTLIFINMAHGTRFDYNNFEDGFNNYRNFTEEFTDFRHDMKEEGEGELSVIMEAFYREFREYHDFREYGIEIPVPFSKWNIDEYCHQFVQGWYKKRYPLRIGDVFDFRAIPVQAGVFFERECNVPDPLIVASIEDGSVTLVKEGNVATNILAEIAYVSAIVGTYGYSFLFELAHAYDNNYCDRLHDFDYMSKISLREMDDMLYDECEEISLEIISQKKGAEF